MNSQSNRTLKLAVSAVIAALYAALTIALAPISYGPLQFRVSEALTVIPFLIPGTVWGLFIGCILANLYTGSVLDILFGSLATLLAALLTAHFGKKGNTVKNRLLGCLMPVVFNALTVGVGEAGVLYLIGYPLMQYLPRIRFFRDMREKCR